MPSSSTSFLARALIAGAILSISCSFIEYGAVEGLGDGVKRMEFDYFKLAIQWPGTFCRRTRHCCSTNACCRGSNSPAEFTIHGLWPDYNDGTWPACCTQSHFDEKEISSLVDVLQKYWPSLSCGSTSTCYGGKGSFWAHEWEKHGTCSYPVFRDENEYFLATINLYFKYNVNRVLFDAGYISSNTEKYPLGGVITAIHNVFHLTLEVAGSNGAVQEIYMCFYKDFTPRECAVRARSVLMKETSKSSCPKYVSLPEFVSKEAPPGGSSAPSHLNSSTKAYLLQTNADIHGGMGRVDV